jgi:nicotinamide mononucleotide transporter
MTITEILGFITGALCVWLAAREHIWNWPIGIANNLFYFVVFWRSKLYADACLQIVYLLISIYGWYKWAHRAADNHELPVSRVAFRDVVLLGVVTTIAALVLHGLLGRYTDSTVPWGDGITTAMSLTAQYMLSRKLLENWLLWILADVIYVALYAYKHLYLTSFLYAIFIAMCVSGFVRWRKSLSKSSALSFEQDMAAASIQP